MEKGVEEGDLLLESSRRRGFPTTPLALTLLLSLSQGLTAFHHSLYPSALRPAPTDWRNMMRYAVLGRRAAAAALNG